MKPNRKRKGLLTGLLCLFLLTACKSGVPSASDVKDTQSYTLPQSMIIVATERNRYQQVYTDQIWDVTLKNGETFQAYLLNHVQAFLQNLKTMTLLAQDQNITLTAAEKDQLHRLSETYYKSLTPQDIAYMGIRLEDVTILYQEYYLANKVVEELTKELDLEVSDSDAKVITLQQIETDSEEAAVQIYTQATAEGSDFETIAKEQSKNVSITRQLGRGEASGIFEDTAFSLVTGEVSAPFQSDNIWYILKCVSDYDVKATAERKACIYNERKRQVFQQIYTQFQAKNSIRFSDDVWGDITFSPEDNTTTSNFFELYQKEFGSQGY